MIQNEWKSVTVKDYATTRDAYGVQQISTDAGRQIKMVVKQYSRQNVQNPDFVDVQFIGLTEDKDINENNIVVIDSKNYRIKYVIPTRTYTEVFLYEFS